MTESKDKKRQGQGRPLGHLYAWLMDQHCDFGEDGNHVSYEPSLEKREHARTLLKASAAGRDFIEKTERALRPGEPDEPLTVPR